MFSYKSFFKKKNRDHWLSIEFWKIKMRLPLFSCFLTLCGGVSRTVVCNHVAGFRAPTIHHCCSPPWLTCFVKACPFLIYIKLIYFCFGSLSVHYIFYSFSFFKSTSSSYMLSMSDFSSFSLPHFPMYEYIKKYRHLYINLLLLTYIL